MARNRFEQVDEKQDDAVTLSLWKVGDSMYGTVTIPAALSGGKLPADITTDKMPLKDAFRGRRRSWSWTRIPCGRRNGVISTVRCN